MAGRIPEASNTSHSFWTILLLRFGVMEGRVAGIDADVIARSSSSLRDARDESLHTEVEASDANWLSSPEPGSSTPNNFCISAAARGVHLVFVSVFAKNIKLVLH